MMSAYPGVHEQSEDLASSDDISTDAIGGSPLCSQHMLLLKSDIVPTGPDSRMQEQGPWHCPPVLPSCTKVGIRSGVKISALLAHKQVTLCSFIHLAKCSLDKHQEDVLCITLTKTDFLGPTLPHRLPYL